VMGVVKILWKVAPVWRNTATQWLQLDSLADAVPHHPGSRTEFVFGWTRAPVPRDFKKLFVWAPFSLGRGPGRTYGFGNLWKTWPTGLRMGSNFSDVWENPQATYARWKTCGITFETVFGRIMSGAALYKAGVGSGCIERDMGLAFICIAAFHRIGVRASSTSA
jgi:hypothetical protein